MLYLKASTSEFIQMESWKEKAGSYAKIFLMNDQRNNNGWRVTWESIKKNAKDFIGKPGIEYLKCVDGECDLDHTDAVSYEQNLKVQEKFRVSTIIDVVFDESTHSVYAIHEIHDDSFAHKLQTKEVRYVSPAIWPKQGQFEILGKRPNGTVIIDVYAWYALHSAYVNNPAFGDDAKVVAQCHKEGESCNMRMLSARETLQAEDDLLPLQEIPLLVRHQGKHVFVSVSKQVMYKLQPKLNSGTPLTESDVISAYSACGDDSKKSCGCEKKKISSLKSRVEVLALKIRVGNLTAKIMKGGDDDSKQEEKGTWVTSNGQHIFIKDGEDKGETVKEHFKKLEKSEKKTDSESKKKTSNLDKQYDNIQDAANKASDIASFSKEQETDIVVAVERKAHDYLSTVEGHPAFGTAFDEKRIRAYAENNSTPAYYNMFAGFNRTTDQNSSVDGTTIKNTWDEAEKIKPELKSIRKDLESQVEQYNKSMNEKLQNAESIYRGIRTKELDTIISKTNKDAEPYEYNYVPLTLGKTQGDGFGKNYHGITMEYDPKMIDDLETVQYDMYTSTPITQKGEKYPISYADEEEVQTYRISDITRENLVKSITVWDSDVTDETLQKYKTHMPTANIIDNRHREASKKQKISSLKSRVEVLALKIRVSNLTAKIMKGGDDDSKQEEKGTWVTSNGQHIFIKDGEDKGETVKEHFKKLEKSKKQTDSEGKKSEKKTDSEGKKTEKVVNSLEKNKIKFKFTPQGMGLDGNTYEFYQDNKKWVNDNFQWNRHRKEWTERFDRYEEIKEVRDSLEERFESAKKEAIKSSAKDVLGSDYGMANRLGSSEIKKYRWDKNTTNDEMFNEVADKVYKNMRWGAGHDETITKTKIKESLIENNPDVKSPYKNNNVKLQTGHNQVNSWDEEEASDRGISVEQLHREQTRDTIREMQSEMFSQDLG